MSRAIAVFLILTAVTPVAAQTARPRPAGPPGRAGTQFMPRFDFRFDLEHLSTDDPRFVWDANIAGEVDFVDFGRGRVTFGAAYENVLGREYQPFDPLQGQYVLQGSATGRVGAVEIGGLIHHVSRHLGDRSKTVPVDWNMVGARVQTAMTRGTTNLVARVDMRKATKTSFVDYEWEFSGDARAGVDVTPRVAVIAAGGVQVMTTDGTGGRGTQHGLRGEGGVRFGGERGALELFAAVERRLDPFQLQRSTMTWFATGFRLTSR